MPGTLSGWHLIGFQVPAPFQLVFWFLVLAKGSRCPSLGIPIGEVSLKADEISPKLSFGGPGARYWVKNYGMRNSRYCG